MDQQPWYTIICILAVCTPFLCIIWMVDHTVGDDEEVEYDADDDHRNHVE